ncbi:non-specific lipid-transfer protein-like [Spinacia oleracea]|uniref:Non-specific lipid-transfer protein n=1 Tax=Spinacia oleracea TaxID=3562 RepID=A0ABM3QTF2_SPIOL|nr:non-specific lipid-transfer protein-like [Spinacia oleracea]
MASSAAVVIKLACTTTLLLLCMVLTTPPQQAEAAITCGVVTSKLTPCISFLKGGPAPAAACCNGVRFIRAAPLADRRTACSCIVDLAKSLSGINYGKAFSLPGKCGVSIPFALSCSTMQ